MQSTASHRYFPGQFVFPFETHGECEVWQPIYHFRRLVLLDGLAESEGFLPGSGRVLCRIRPGTEGGQAAV